MSTESASGGIVFLDHTADVGLAVSAPTLPELFIRTARGMTLLIHGTEREKCRATDPGGREPTRIERRMSLRADDLPGLLRLWLRELLYWHESEGVSFEDARFGTLSETLLGALVTVTPDEHEPVREIKGVTLHGLVAERGDGGWVSQVIFDV
ncbi:MAG: archease [Gemmatimonadota bacterium]